MYEEGGHKNEMINLMEYPTPGTQHVLGLSMAQDYKNHVLIFNIFATPIFFTKSKLAFFVLLCVFICVFICCGFWVSPLHPSPGLGNSRSQKKTLPSETVAKVKPWPPWHPQGGWLPRDEDGRDADAEPHEVADQVGGVRQDRQAVRPHPSRLLFEIPGQSCDRTNKNYTKKIR